MRVILTFNLNEEVTPEIFASKVALACARGGAIRQGESVESESAGEGMCNKFTHIGWIETDMGGMLSEEIPYPNIGSSRTC
jgi:hypothetical protein